jgi:hypothetical protein
MIGGRESRGKDGERRRMGDGVEWSERILKLRREMRGEHGV